MPLFEYRCEQCDHVFEVLVRGAETVECPGCQSQRVEKLLSTAAAHVNESGQSLPVAPSCPYGDNPPCHSGQCPM